MLKKKETKKPKKNKSSELSRHDKLRADIFTLEQRIQFLKSELKEENKNVLNTPEFKKAKNQIVKITNDILKNNAVKVSCYLFIDKSDLALILEDRLTTGNVFFFDINSEYKESSFRTKMMGKIDKAAKKINEICKKNKIKLQRNGKTISEGLTLSDFLA